MTRWTSTHPESVTPYIPGGEYAHTVTRFLNATQQEICAGVRDNARPEGACINYVNCVFEQLPEYDKAGLGVGTTLLTLIPMALSSMPTSELDVYAIWMLPGTSRFKRSSLFILAAFSGFLQAGQALREIVDHELQPGDVQGTASLQGGTESHTSGGNVTSRLPCLEQVWERWNAMYRLRPGRRSSRSSHWLHWTLLFFSSIFCLLIIYSSVAIGYLGVVTWSCDNQPISLSWTLARIAPPVIEACILVNIHRWLRSRLSRSGKPRTTAGSSNVELVPMRAPQGDELNLIASTVSSVKVPRGLLNVLRAGEIFCRAVDASLVLYGTAALGSTILIDGIPAMIFLLLIPGLYGAMQLCLHEMMRGIHLGVDKAS